VENGETEVYLLPDSRYSYTKRLPGEIFEEKNGGVDGFCDACVLLFFHGKLPFWITGGEDNFLQA
jgi:hypothetical protein